MNRKVMEIRKFCLGVFLVFSLAGCQKESSTLALDSSWADMTLQEKGISADYPGRKEEISMNRLESYREAKIELYRKLENDILNLKIDVKRDVRAFIGEDKKLKEKIATFLKGTRITEAVYTPRKGMELSGQLYLGEGFKSILGLMEKKGSEEKGNPTQQHKSSPGSGF
jgi:hypothetical protein